MAQYLPFLAVVLLAFPSPAQEPTRLQPASYQLSQGTKVSLAAIRPVWTKSAKAGDTVYAVVAFPVSAGDHVAIPAGTYVEGVIEEVTPPSRKDRAELTLRFERLIYANGYAVPLPDIHWPASALTRTHIILQATRANDLLLDNGTQFDLTLPAALPLDSGQVEQALGRTASFRLNQLRSASRCLPTQGTPGTDPVVIPGTDATPPTVIPGAPGMPDIVIPGTPGTPSTVIPGTPGSPGSVCPAPPLVISSTPL